MLKDLNEGGDRCLKEFFASEASIPVDWSPMITLKTPPISIDTTALERSLNASVEIVSEFPDEEFDIIMPESLNDIINESDH